MGHITHQILKGTKIKILGTAHLENWASRESCGKDGRRRGPGQGRLRVAVFRFRAWGLGFRVRLQGFGFRL